MANYSRNSIEMNNRFYGKHIKSMASEVTAFDFNHVLPVPTSLPESVDIHDLYALANHLHGLGLQEDQLQDFIRPIDCHLTAKMIAPYKAEFEKLAADGDLDGLLAQGAKTYANLLEHGAFTAYQWRLANWNTENAFAVQVRRRKVDFMTVWGGALPVIKQWAKNDSLSMTYKCFSSGSHNWFVADFEDGELVSMRQNDSADMRPLLKEMYGYSDADIDALYS